MRLPPSEPRPELDRLIALAVEKVKAMTPGELSAMRRAQRLSWLRGEIGIEHPELSDEEIERLILKVLDENLQG